MANYYIGLMSGTSLDGVDGVIVDSDINIIAKVCLPYPLLLKQALKTLIKNGKASFIELANIDKKVAQIFATTANTLLKMTNLTKTSIAAIGSHGHTVFHKGGVYSMQIGHGSFIAEQTGIKVVNDFRMGDIAANGQGAPITPIYHNMLLKKNDAIIINLGGIANLTQVVKTKIIGFDTGPANTLLDSWIKKCRGDNYDKDGLWARCGNIDKILLSRLLSDPYFAQPSPKSTSVEYFNLNWLMTYLQGSELEGDVQRTLLELTVMSISRYITKGLDVYLCGGGVHNLFLFERLKFLNYYNKIFTTNELGVDVDYVEAVAFAFFAKQALEGIATNLSEVTGAKGAKVLGAIHAY